MSGDRVELMQTDLRYSRLLPIQHVGAGAQASADKLNKKQWDQLSAQEYGGGLHDRFHLCAPTVAF
jgi:hypothetical protein